MFGAHRPARVQAVGGDADLAAEAELAAVGELGRGVDQDDGAVDTRREPFGGLGVGGDDGLGVARAVAGEVIDGGFAMGSNLPLFANGESDAGGADTVTTSDGQTKSVPKKANFGTLSSGGLY